MKKRTSPIDVLFQIVATAAVMSVAFFFCAWIYAVHYLLIQIMIGLVGTIITIGVYKGLQSRFKEISERPEMPNSKPTERILCAAIWFDDGITGRVHQPKNIDTGYVICGRRHHNCFATHAVFRDRDFVLKSTEVEQGFVTSNDFFVDRKEAARIAYLAGQIDFLPEALLSEHLW